LINFFVSQLKKMKIFTILALLIAIAAAVFASQNASPVAIYLLGWNYQTPFPKTICPLTTSPPDLELSRRAIG